MSSKNLAMMYGAKKASMPKMGKNCPECMSAGGKCMAHGGMVESNHELEASEESIQPAPHEMVDSDLPSSAESSMEESDRPELSESLSLASEVMKDRKRLKMARGGKVPSRDEMDAPMEDGRESRGLNISPAQSMEDSEHDVSDASLVSEILKDRKKRRMGM